MRQQVSPRFAGIALAASLHLAVGWELWSLAAAGVPHDGLTGVGMRTILLKLTPATNPAYQPAIALAKSPELSSSRAPLFEAGGRTLARTNLTDLPGVTSASGSPQPTLDRPPSMDGLPDSETLAYRTLLESHLAQYRLYPPSARLDGDQGVVVLHFIADRDGKVLDAWIESSFGSSAIDDEALGAIARAQPLPHFPSDWPDKLDISLAVSFKLG